LNPPMPKHGIFLESFPWTAQGQGDRNLVILDGLRVENVPHTGLSLQGIADALHPLATCRKVWTLGLGAGLTEGSTISALAQSIEPALESLIPGTKILMASGHGGALALEIAARRPDLVHALILISTGPKLSDTGREIYKKLIALASRLRWDDVHALLAETLFSHKAGAILGALLARIFSGDLGKPASAWDFLVSVQAELAWDGMNLIKKITCPVLVLSGEKDRLYNSVEILRAWENHPTCEVEIWKGRPHALLKTDRDKLTDRLIAFMEKVEPALICPLA